MSLYRSVEGTFFNSLSKKIIGNIAFLSIPCSLICVFAYLAASSVESSLAQIDSLQSNDIKSTLSQLKWLSLAILIFSLSASIGIALFMRHLFLKPIQTITSVLKAVKDKDGDISAELSSETIDEIADMAESYNEFTASLKSMIAESRNKSVNVAVCSNQLKKALKHAQESAKDQELHAQMIVESSEESTTAIDNIATSANSIADNNAKNLEDIKQSNTELAKVKAQINSILHQVNSFQDTVGQLEQNSQNIMHILTMVKEFSDQTNLLALNASIEAARAGEAGRGFSVVADEVRALSQKVGNATNEIDQNIKQMSGLVEDTKSSSSSIMEHVNSTDSFISDTSEQFNTMVSDFEHLSLQLSNISAASDQLLRTNQQAHEKVCTIAQISNVLFSDIDHSQKVSESLEQSTEQTQELLSRFIIGYGSFESIVQKVREAALETQTRMESLADQGIDLFDTNYKPLNAGQVPEKFDTSYSNKFEQVLQPYFDDFTRLNDEFIYAIAVDKKGYAPTHLSRCSKPITGDFEKDNLDSRHKRFFFSTRAEQRRATSTAPFLLQCYLRDTGEILNDLSIPIYVNGKHWGALITGFLPEKLID